MEEKSEIQTSLPDPCTLLGGQPRSGTTLLSSILRNSDNHFQAFELHIRKPSFIVGLQGRYTKRIFSELGLPESEYDSIINSYDLSNMNLGAWVGPKEEVSAEALTGNETQNFVGELIARGQIVTLLMRKTAQLNHSQTWGFKILSDIMYADIYRKVWPNARFVLMIRDPRDQAISILKLNTQRTSRNQSNFYDDIKQAALGWKKTIKNSRHILKNCGIPWFEIRYEDLVFNPHKNLELLGNFLGIDLMVGVNFQDKKFVKAHTKRFKHHNNLLNPINTGSVGRWRELLTKSDLRVFDDTLGDMMQEFNYLS